MQGRLSAYFTVEAALVMPMVLWVVLFVIYALFFTYDRCLLEQQTGILTMRGVGIQRQDKEERLIEMMCQASDLSEDGYLAWESGSWRVRMEWDHVQVQREGQLLFPFTGWGLPVGESHWDTAAEYEMQILRPASFLRMWRNIRELADKEQEETEDDNAANGIY